MIILMNQTVNLFNTRNVDYVYLLENYDMIQKETHFVFTEPIINN